MDDANDNRFPARFLWGAATSSHQVEGNNNLNDWWEWEEAGGTQPSGMACDHYNRFREDFDIARELGHNVHRFSLEWSRLEKDDGVWDDSEWAHYREVIDELLSRGIEPIVTLYHFTLPLWLSRKGGWKNDDIVGYFSRFAEKAVKELGRRAQCWITINEPLVLAFIAYFQGKWPPFVKNFDDMMYVTNNMLKAHGEAYIKMKEAAMADDGIKRPEIGLAKAVATFHPCSNYSLTDRLSAHLRAIFQNHSFIKSSITGRALFFPYNFGKLPFSNTLDFIGLNYYFREFIHHKFPIFKNPFGWVCSRAHHMDAGRRTGMGWEVYPPGIYEVVKGFTRYGLPIIISENGLSTDDDSFRRDYIKQHLLQLLRAIKEGVPVQGYLHWSLLDNFEWDSGYSQRFGLVHVDFETQKRTIKDSARYYAEIIRSGRVLD